MNIRAYTIMEIMIVVVILGVLASIGIPSYGNMVERTHLSDAQMQLRAIHAANKLYYAKTRTYWPATTTVQSILSINSDLGLNIMENGMTYACTGVGGGATYQCTATRNFPNVGTTFVVKLTQADLSDLNPICDTSVHSCP